MQELLFKCGITSYLSSIITPIPLQPTDEITIAKKVPDQMGLIYGMAIYADTVDPENNPLITTANAQALYMTLRDGNTLFFDNLRLSDMLQEFAGSPVIRADKYMPVTIPGTFDFSTSFYSNPGQIVSAPAPAKPTSIMLNFWYIDTDQYAYLMEKGFVSGDAERFMKAKKR